MVGWGSGPDLFLFFASQKLDASISGLLGAINARKGQKKWSSEAVEYRSRGDIAAAAAATTYTVYTYVVVP